MRFSLVTALVLALLGLTRGLATASDKEKFCEFLEGVEDDRLHLAGSLTRKALSVAHKVIPMLGSDSDFGKFIHENRVPLSIANTDTKIKFILHFRCNYKSMILYNRRYSDNPEFQNIYKTYKSESNAEIAKFDQLMARDASKMLIRMRGTSSSTKNEFSDALNSYMDRKGIVAHCMMDRFLQQAKSKYECTYVKMFL